VDPRHNGYVHRSITAETNASVDRLYEVISDLGTYGEWMTLIDRCEVAVAASDDQGPAWWVTLRAKVGPFARSKRLRMVRTQMTQGSSVRFERRETDGRSHSAWVMNATCSPLEGKLETTAVTVELSYSGGLWSGPLDAVLGSQVNDSVPRLQQYLLNH
jgi:Polyketide cyclase / dehydrase and lipid transport